MSLDWTVTGTRVFAKNYEERDPRSAIARFEAEHGITAEFADDIAVLSHCCLCGLAILSTDDNRNSKIPGHWMHFPSCPQVPPEIASLVNSARLFTIFAAWPDGFEPTRKLDSSGEAINLADKE